MKTFKAKKNNVNIFTQTVNSSDVLKLIGGLLLVNAKRDYRYLSQSN